MLVLYQTPKSLLHAYCTELDCDWEGLQWLLLAAREVVQESIGFSPNDLVFGHAVRGSLAVFQDSWGTVEHRLLLSQMIVHLELFLHSQLP